MRTPAHGSAPTRATTGRYGELERYRQQFRVGFSEGYQAGYARYGGLHQR